MSNGNELMTLSGISGIEGYALPDAVVKNIRQVPTEELKAELGKVLSVTAKQLMYLAFIWRELEERGEDLSDLKSGLAIYLPMIASGRLDADLVVKYAGQTMLLRTMSSLSIQDQRRLLSAGEIEVAAIGSDGQMKVEKQNLSLVHVRDLRFIFGEGYVRPLQEQFDLRRGNIRRRNGRNVRAPQARYAQAKRVEVDGDQLVVGDMATDLSRVMAALSEHYGINVSKTIEERLSENK